LAGHGIRLHRLATWRHVLAEVEATGRFDAAARAGLASFMEAPLAWSAAHGGRDSHSLAF
ncbi:MAG: hypothetical protein AAFZ09_00140, partial [Pseudomonadota bacterium]